MIRAAFLDQHLYACSFYRPFTLFLESFQTSLNPCQIIIGIAEPRMNNNRNNISFGTEIFQKSLEVEVEIIF